ncbi:signal peptidase II [Kaarinaea lacus]
MDDAVTENERKAPMLKWLWVSGLVIILDLVTKAMASEYLLLHQPVNLFPGFNFTLMHNTGAAFSFLSEATGWQRWFFSIVAIVVSAVIVVWLMKLQKGQTWLAIALAMILGGALGNVWDRLTLGYVVDFIDVYVQTAHWPAFNIADSAISVGAVILIYDSFRGQKKSDDSAASSE